MKKNNNVFWYILTAVLSASTIVFLCLFLSFESSSKTYKNSLENNYKKSYYEVASNINDMEIDLSKIVATTDSSSLKTLLLGLNNNIVKTIDNINELPISYDKLTQTYQYLNRIYGYSYSLLESVLEGKSVSKSDYEQLGSIHSNILAIKYDLNNYYQGLDSSFEIISDDNSFDDFSAGIINTESASSKVPSLIYDGPFSDSVLNREIVGLPTGIISSDEGLQIVKEIFETADVKYLGFANGKFEVYNYFVNKESGLNVSITKQGGFLLNITSFASSSVKSMSIEEGITIAENFAKKLNIDNMYCVWSQVTGNILYVNLAKIENSIIYYSDLIKVKVDLSNGNIIGWEATNYATNNKTRKYSQSISFASAQSNLSSVLEVKERNYCIIPDKYVGEISAYEFVCTWKDYTYYIYIDSNTGEEVNIMRVVNTANGDLLQ